MLYLLMRRQFTPLRQASDHITKMVHQQSSLQPLVHTTEDEVGRLIQSVNCLIIQQNDNQKKLAQAIQKAEQANQMKSTFLASMSHEIRTPMNAVLGLSELGLRVPNNSQKMLGALQKINQSGQLVLALLNDILDVSKIEAGELLINRVPFSLADVFEQLNNQFSALAEQKGLDFVMQSSPDLLPVYRGDSQRLGQVLDWLQSFVHKDTLKCDLKNTNRN
ncbi:sensor histidine kinase [Thiomicrorhabdus aquaedulcis]|uniref:sensor histidine kinase n=1 Tax=Thiomicrorhabdus aquaedulcis TaxID=2211106 RepID=UPI000FD6D593|nr:histidine kinase dimerization/phospho-acceptor domain-containing protein [Thiomicrorhabdus aquaedulcis]